MMSASFSDTRARLVSLHGGCNFRDIGGYLERTAGVTATVREAVARELSE